jgi:2-oxoglutarate dehydrogenase E2 component (dihydrolipoamide succinyltransferase)
MVPVIRDAGSQDLFATARVLQDLTEKTRKGLLGAEHVRGGTFTITNHGVSGSLIATPIINQPQSAILGIGKLEKRVKVVMEDGQDVARIKPVVYVTLTIDHRVLDGFQANTFLNIFVNTLEGWTA